ncbi:MAG: bacterial Ig-like domain-containing protein [Velocimicrobium sp.]
MKKKNYFLKRGIAILLSLAMVSGNIVFSPNMAEASEESKATLTVDMANQTGDILHGASGFLYGVSSEDVPTTNTMVPLKPKVLCTKGPLGTEHPYGDTFDVAKTFLESGGEQVMMYNSNYYGVFGVTANYQEYAEVLKTIIAPAVVKWKAAWKKDHANDNLSSLNIDKAIVYIPINEGTPVNGADFNVSWKAYYDAIKLADPNATIAGPNSAGYGLQFGTGVSMKSHFEYCVANDCLPDIVTWHELQVTCLSTMAEHMEDFKNIWSHLDTDLEMPQIVINEYADLADCGVPGRLVNWISRLEDQKIYGCLPFWHQANNLNDLTSDANEGNSAWWLYKWYGDMSGKTLKVSSSTTYDKLYGVAAIDDTKKNASVLFGGLDGSTEIVLKNIKNTATYQNADRVHIKIQSTGYTGYEGTQSNVPTVLEGTYPVNEDGSVTVNLSNMKFSFAYNLTITKAEEGDEVSNPIVYVYQNSYEAEDALLGDGSTKVVNTAYSPNYYLSENYAVKMQKENSLTYTIDVPVDGKYRLDYIYGNGTGTLRNDANNNNPINVEQTYCYDNAENKTEIMKNTLIATMTATDTQYVDLTKGEHTIKIVTTEEGTVLQDVLNVTYSGAYEKEIKALDNIYEAEQADFNNLLGTGLTVITKSDIKGYSGNGYVTGLTKSVTAGGGIRWNLIVEESGLYDVSIRYQSGEAGSANVYVGNTTKTLNQLINTIDVVDTNNQWKTETTTIYLQKGINIVDIDTSVEVSLDYLRLKEIPDSLLTQDAKATLIEAEDCIPEGAEFIAIGNSKGASSGKYVVGLEGDEDAASDRNKYLEFEYNALGEGAYSLQVFQSNDEICGSHSYNTKIIDKYATVEVSDETGKTISSNRYFFINTFSKDTFKEKTITLNLVKGTNKIKIYNDDSWQVLWGGTTYTPGTNKLDNYSPNFDKFLIRPVTLKTAIDLPEEYGINIQTTSWGYATVDKNAVDAGGTFMVKIYPNKGIDNILVNGEEKKSTITSNGDGTYSLKIENVQNDITVSVHFTKGYTEHQDTYIENAGFGKGTLDGWNADTTTALVTDAESDSLEGYYLNLGKGVLTQEVSGIPGGKYNLCVYAKDKNAAGTVTMSAGGESMTLEAGADTYMENFFQIQVVTGTAITIKVDATALTQGSICLDNFTLEKVTDRNPESIDTHSSYFVDCGDHNPQTLTGYDNFGLNNSITDQVFGKDKVTGYYWGVYDPNGNNAESSPSDGVYTKYISSNQNSIEDNQKKEVSFVYAKSQKEAGIAERYVNYKFQLDDTKQYKVLICVGNSWENSGNPDIYVNKGTSKEAVISDSIAMESGANAIVSGNATTDGNGYMTVDVRSSDATIQVNYIRISEFKGLADMTNLTEVYNTLRDTANDMEDPYSTETWATFESVLQTVKFLLDDQDAIGSENQEKIDLAAVNLQSAFDALKKATNVSKELLYFVDCGDYNVATLTEGEKFGQSNRVTDQVFGEDAATKKNWGAIDTDYSISEDAKNLIANGFSPTFTSFTWPSEYTKTDGEAKTTTFRYARDQDKAGITERYVNYKFQLEAGKKYEVSVSLGNSWNCSSPISVYANKGVTGYESIIKENATIQQNGNTVVTGIGQAGDDGYMTVDVRSSAATIQLCYITIKASDGTDPAPDPTQVVLNGMKVNPPDKTVYKLGESIDLSGLAIIAYYSDGSSDRIRNASKYTVTGFDSSSLGEKTVKIQYSYGSVTKEFSFPVIIADQTVESVSINPRSSEVEQGQMKDFAADVVTLVTGASIKVNWSVSGSNSLDTNISSKGRLVVGEDETAKTLIVMARSKADNSKVDTAIVTVLKKPIIVPVVGSVQVSPKEVTLERGNNQTFTANVIATGAALTVNWSVSGNQSENTKISDMGVLLVGEDEWAETFCVTATSTEDPTKSDTAVVKVDNSDSQSTPVFGRDEKKDDSKVTISVDEKDTKLVLQVNDMEKAISTIKEGENIAVTIPYATQLKDVILTKDLLNKLSDEKKNAIIEFNDQKGEVSYRWFFGESVASKISAHSDINLVVKTNPILLEKENNSAINSILTKKQDSGTYISTAQTEALPVQGDLSVKVSDVKVGQKVYVYKVNDKTKKLETMVGSFSHKVDENGYVTLGVLEGGDYLVLTEKAAKNQVTLIKHQIKIDIKQKTMKVGKTSKVSVLLPTCLNNTDVANSSAIGKVKITYKVSNKKVASIDKNGKVKAKRAGTVIITTTITLYNGSTRTEKTKIYVKATKK